MPCPSTNIHWPNANRHRHKITNTLHNEPVHQPSMALSRLQTPYVLARKHHKSYSMLAVSPHTKYKPLWFNRKYNARRKWSNLLWHHIDEAIYKSYKKHASQYQRVSITKLLILVRHLITLTRNVFSRLIYEYLQCVHLAK